MSKLRGAKKEEFLKRTARGRAKAKRSNPTKKKKPATKKNTAGKLKGKAKEEFLRRMARGRAKAKRSPNPKTKKKNAKRRNQEPGSLEAAAEQFERFHGKPPGRILEYDLQLRYPEHFAELGRLKELRIYLNDDNPAFAFGGFGACQVVSTPDGSNIYFLGGDQSIDLAAMDIASDKDQVELGACVYIAYHTVKGFHDFEPTTYWHEFGEEDGIYPVLVYDRLNKTLFLISGNYRVRPEGIVN